MGKYGVRSSLKLRQHCQDYDYPSTMLLSFTLFYGVLLLVIVGSSFLSLCVGVLIGSIIIINSRLNVWKLGYWSNGLPLWDEAWKSHSCCDFIIFSAILTKSFGVNAIHPSLFLKHPELMVWNCLKSWRSKMQRQPAPAWERKTDMCLATLQIRWVFTAQNFEHTLTFQNWCTVKYSQLV